MNWTEKHIKGLLFQKKIKGFNAPEKKPAGTPTLPQPKSKALIWLEWNLQFFCNERALTLEREYRVCQERGWRFDFFISAHKIAIEFEGGVFLQKSGHNTPKSYTKDTDKYNKAAALGIRVVRITALNYTTVLKTLNEMIA